LAQREEDTSHDNSMVPTIWKIFNRKCKQPQASTSWICM